MNKNKMKGTAWESAVVAYLKDDFPNVERRAQSGAFDKGDLTGIPNWVFELKNHATITLAEFVDQAKQEAKNADAPWYAAIIKRRNRGVGDAYVVLPLERFKALLLLLGQD